MLAEKGYMAKKELEANLMLMAARQSQAKKAKLFDFASKPHKANGGVKQSTLEERRKTFEAIENM